MTGHCFCIWGGRLWSFSFCSRRLPPRSSSSSRNTIVSSDVSRDTATGGESVTTVLTAFLSKAAEVLSRYKQYYKMESLLCGEP